MLVLGLVEVRFGARSRRPLAQQIGEALGARDRGTGDVHAGEAGNRESGGKCKRETRSSREEHRPARTARPVAAFYPDLALGGAGHCVALPPRELRLTDDKVSQDRQWMNPQKSAPAGTLMNSRGPARGPLHWRKAALRSPHRCEFPGVSRPMRRVS